MDASFLKDAINTGSSYTTSPKTYNSLSMGQMGNSVCQLYFQYNNLYPPEHIKPELARTFSLGNATESILVKAIGKSDMPFSTSTQVRLEALPFNGRTRLNGYVDMLLSSKETTDRFVLEFKSMNDANFQKFITHGVRESHPNYFAQVQLYMHVGQFSPQGYLIAMNKNTSEIHVEEIPYDAGFSAELISKAKYVIRMEHPFKDRSNALYPRRCSECFDHEICYMTREA